MTRTCIKRESSSLGGLESRIGRWGMGYDDAVASRGKRSFIKIQSVSYLGPYTFARESE